MKIYTKKGDKGLTKILGGKIVKKSNIRIETYGTIDELNSYIGLINSKLKIKNIAKDLLKIQNTLFVTGSLLSCDPDKKNIKIPKIKEGDISFLERKIDEFESQLPKITKFILPGGSEISSHCHIARCICRRAERLCVKLETAHQIELIKKYLNRLSDYIFVISRYINNTYNYKEIYWEGKN